MHHRINFRYDVALIKLASDALVDPQIWFEGLLCRVGVQDTCVTTLLASKTATPHHKP